MLAQVQAPGGARFTVAASVAPQFQGLVADLEAAGYKINPKDVSSYRPGAVVAGTNTPSQHASAFAIDVNASNNRVGTPGEIPPDLARSLAAKYGLRWGGDFSHNRDPMHFDALRPRSDAGDTAGPQGTQVASLGLPSGVMSDVPSGIIPAAAPGSSPPSISEGPDLNILRQGGSTKSSQPGVRDYMLNQSPVAQNMANRVASFRSEMYPLLAAQDALAKAPTGKGSETLQSVSSYINTFAPELLQRALSHISPILSKDEVAAYDEARKYTTQIQLGAPGATRSNEGQAAAGAANPSVGISNEAAKVVLKGLISLRRMEQDEGQSWIKSKRPPAELNNFRAEFQNQTDPRMYLFDQMSPTERSQTLASFGDNTRKRMEFMAGVERAERNGVLSAPRGGQ
jgi:hypothetical protein